MDNIVILKREILLVENQFSQFEKIAFHLGKERVYPNTDWEFTVLMDAVRVYLNPRYSPSKRAAALETVINTVISVDPKLLIVDYVLGSHHLCDNGIDLAFAISAHHRVPIVFLSRSTSESHEIREARERLAAAGVPSEWARKGPWGANITDPHLFEREVGKALQRVRSAIGEQELSELIERVLQKIRSPICENLRDRTNLINLLNSIKISESVDQSTKEIICRFENDADWISPTIYESFAEDLRRENERFGYYICKNL